MDEQGLGTKATRPDIIQKLYSRKYVRNHPPEPTATGMAMYEAFKEWVPEMATSEMTAGLEVEMDQIAEGKMSKEEVVDDSRKLVHSTFDAMREGEEALSKMIWAGMDKDRSLGPCIVCKEAGRTKEDGSPNMLRIIRAKKSGKSFVGCSGWKPDDPEACDQTFPMPQPNFYEVTPLEENCSICHRTSSVGQGSWPRRLSLEALLQRRLPDHDRDAREEGRASRRPGSQEEDGSPGRQEEDQGQGEAEEEVDGQAAHQDRCRRQGRPARPGHPPDQEGRLPQKDRLGIRRVHHARGCRRFRQDYPGLAPGRGAGRGHGAIREPVAPRRPNRSATCSPTPGPAGPGAELLLFCAARAD
jgi:DNA topoisomerase-1